ncbi:hypothetical protein BBI15_10235 [Planococcus plakortidis]|uniref:DUF4181 domain-containing protein n=1 Tax=Planococcus plakortidis TaxID=1038856 RepID=A0A1C7EAV6_9BACL|nr:DUF4181 domain-containing protein [Planococcus plakortidis]ANU20567.1 hypothetical protein BBI15_10235 [Planococcus plakortidis]
MWLEIGLVILGIVILVSIVKFILSKLLKIEKEKKDFFSCDYINEQHRKIERWVRWSWMLVSIFLIYLVLYRELPVTLYLSLFIAWIATEAFVRAYFQWKYSEQPKQAVLTLSEMTVWISAVTSVVYFDVFNFLT